MLLSRPDVEDDSSLDVIWKPLSCLDVLLGVVVNGGADTLDVKPGGALHIPVYCHGRKRKMIKKMTEGVMGTGEFHVGAGIMEVQCCAACGLCRCQKVENQMIDGVSDG